MDLLKFAQKLIKLKETKRSGWVVSKVKNPESVAEHSFATAVLTLVLAKKYNLDEAKALKMALLHDLGEAEIGDLIIYVGAKEVGDKKAKVKKEREGLKKILSLIDQEELTKLFDEFEENKTPEAKLVKQLDKLEMAIQALHYEKSQGKKNLGSFFETTDMMVKDEYLREILKEFKEKRLV